MMGSRAAKKKIVPLPFPIYWGTLFILTIAGIADAIYLLFSHYRLYTDIAYKSFCAISRAINCDTVAQSSSSVFGGAPVAFWGLVGYLGFAILLIFAGSRMAEKKRLFRLLVLSAACFNVINVILAVIAIRYIHSYCIMCILSYAISFALWFFAWLTRRRFDAAGFWSGLLDDVLYIVKRKKVLFSLLIFLALAGSVAAMYPDYWKMAPPPLAADLDTGLTAEGYPWIGATSPLLTITEFSDYMCFQCKKSHFMLRRLVARYPRRIRLVHRHFPMDNTANPLVREPFHIGAAMLARCAIYAATQGRFWPMNDFLFSIAKAANVISTKEMAARTGLDEKLLSSNIGNQNIGEKLAADIRDGIKLGITGTPSFLIDGHVYTGIIPPEIFRQLPQHNRLEE